MHRECKLLAAVGSHFFCLSLRHNHWHADDEMLSVTVMHTWKHGSMSYWHPRLQHWPCWYPLVIFGTISAHPHARRRGSVLIAAVAKAAKAKSSSMATQPLATQAQPLWLWHLQLQTATVGKSNRNNRHRHRHQWHQRFSSRAFMPADTSRLESLLLSEVSVAKARLAFSNWCHNEWYNKCPL